MNLLQRLYDHFTKPLIDEHIRKVKEAQKVFGINRQNAGRNKFQYRKDCRDLNRIERELKSDLITKLNRWNWLKKLI
jgi:hypothetical protein